MTHGFRVEASANLAGSNATSRLFLLPELVRKAWPPVEAASKFLVAILVAMVVVARIVAVVAMMVAMMVAVAVSVAVAVAKRCVAVTRVHRGGRLGRCDTR